MSVLGRLASVCVGFEGYVLVLYGSRVALRLSSLLAICNPENYVITWSCSSEYDLSVSSLCFHSLTHSGAATLLLR